MNYYAAILTAAMTLPIGLAVAWSLPTWQRLAIGGVWAAISIVAGRLEPWINADRKRS